MKALATSPAKAPRLGRWHSTTSWLLSLYAVIFSLSVLLLLGFIGGAVVTDMQSKTDAVLGWQFLYFDALPDSALRDAIAARLEREHTRPSYAGTRLHMNYYGLFGPDGRHLAGDITTLPSDVAAVASGETLDRTLSVMPEDQPPVVRAMARKRADGSMLVIARSLAAVREFRKTVIESLIGGGLLCLLAGVAGGYALSLRLLRRVKELRRVTKRISHGDLAQRLPVGGRDELDMLAQLVNHMLDEVERLMNEVKVACDGIAHDLRTPLAHLHGVLARATERSNVIGDEAMSTLIARASVETDSLLARFQAMLRISEIGALQRQGGFASVQLDTILAEVGELYEPVAENRSIGFAIEQERVEPVHGDRALLFEMFVNLIDNAIKFTPDGGTVRVVLKHTPAGARVDVIDSGIGIAPHEREAVLQRFYRADSARHIAGSGLGLSVVSAVARLHDFSIRIEDAAPGTRVTVESWCHTLA
ncbi:sensor histidine kinase [Trinickia fusca]|uniref:histidine kinase n=1 Tax=Trinickia fusca TaxID=2419777 RepID=A0A494XE49_9BURK|nr:HAMP domain-containing sensor histidine kinase [Trinickia fusca]RKP48162.1 sensor histidine kinase [Trinickia fusca]